MLAETAGSKHYDGFLDICYLMSRHRGQVWSIDDDSSDGTLEQSDGFLVYSPF